MNQDIIKSQWKQLKGEIKQKWGKLTDDDLTLIEGKRDVLEGKIQERYGLAKDKASEEIRAFEERLSKH
ncbi:CsbD family protein [Solimonas sp. SE-A11]|uniref:CsbD family protein n=1 Tax=Solimonas sp. SE-A11 TaxID=3054954 RepID=UPI00259CA665|nr:CsbD family protein [Solimonas sp. SE-A11]MDM4770468.1 CsbD family protein [Solimonas sp. SE-A11]